MDRPQERECALTGVRYVSGPGENVGADAPARASTGAAATTTNDGAVNSNASPQGLPLLKPPYGRLTAISLAIESLRRCPADR